MCSESVADGQNPLNEIDSFFSRVNASVQTPTPVAREVGSILAPDAGFKAIRELKEGINGTEKLILKKKAERPGILERAKHARELERLQKELRFYQEELRVSSDKVAKATENLRQGRIWTREPLKAEGGIPPFGGLSGDGVLGVLNEAKLDTEFSENPNPAFDDLQSNYENLAKAMGVSDPSQVDAVFNDIEIELVGENILIYPLLTAWKKAAPGESHSDFYFRPVKSVALTEKPVASIPASMVDPAIVASLRKSNSRIIVPEDGEGSRVRVYKGIIEHSDDISFVRDRNTGRYKIERFSPGAQTLEPFLEYALDINCEYRNRRQKLLERRKILVEKEDGGSDLSEEEKVH